MAARQLKPEEEKEILIAVDKALVIQRMPGEDLKTMINRTINRKITQDFNLLVTTLYRLDISEKKLNNILQSNPGTDAGDLIAELIIERELEKFRTRQQYRGNNAIPDDEKW